MAESFHCGDLQPVVMTIRACRKLRDCAESRIRRLHIGKRRKAPLTYRLIAIHLREVRLVYRAGTNVLCVDACRRSKLMFQAKAPLHEVGRVKYSIGHGGDRDGRKAGCRVRLSRRAGKLALRKSGTERLIRSHGCVHRTARNPGRNGCPTNGSKKPALESLDVGRIDANDIGDGSRAICH